jgi:hypothetical protein
MQSKIYSSLYCLALIVSFYVFASPVAQAYSVLTHQAVVDAAWDKSLKPLLLKRYPKATEEDLHKAHAYSYGGSIIQDMGYFPFGNVFFTDLVHYVRTGDFVENLIQSAETLDEYAFALGALAHYNSDIYGHPVGTNRAVALVYPKVKAKYGDTITYADDPTSHIKMEFGFDVLQVARGNYAPESYMNFIGFEVAPEVLEKAFLETYGLKLGDIFVNLPLAIGSYRLTIRGLIPELTKAAWHAKKNDIQQAQPGMTQRKFTYRMRMARYKEQWGDNYDRPNVFARFVAWIIKIAPKIGPLKPLAFVPPTPEAEKFFMESFNLTVDNYSLTLKQLETKERKALRNIQLDTGEVTKTGDYELADETYAKLLEKLSKDDFKQVSPQLRANILSFYKGFQIASDKQDKHAKIAEHLTNLKTLNQ